MGIRKGGYIYEDGYSAGADQNDDEYKYDIQDKSTKDPEQYWKEAVRKRKKAEMFFYFLLSVVLLLVAATILTVRWYYHPLVSIFTAIFAFVFVLALGLQFSDYKDCKMFESWAARDYQRSIR